ncbi:Holliday junction branch migration protein RuvA [Jeotgalibaca dankookensis]|uniref:Holliday junction branch migration protein RuvA n=1 Tax=Jeotgalibaca dankookensis TaxID=708126 RepID=UPI000782BCC9|nr:Holliday junction branch migration protein RuvA [Jeotgalibaca dankookensis]
MYEYMRGKLEEIHPLYVVLELSGIGYQILVANPFRYSSQLKQEIQLYIYQAVREDSQTLYGFKDFKEKQLYLKLISVSGIGPKSGLSILANGNHEGLIQAIENENSKYLTKFPGVGKKTASQIILDLKGKLSDLLDGSELDVSEGLNSHADTYISEAEEALQGLGYSTREVTKIMPQLKATNYTSTEEVLRVAFKLLLKG